MQKWRYHPHSKGVYCGSTSWARRYCEHNGIHLLEEDATDTAKFSKSIQLYKPKIVHVEVPSNPWIKLCDIEKISEATQATGANLIVDATAASPALLKPIMHGADLVVHSATKVLNGHSDVIAGVISCRDATTKIWEYIDQFRSNAGAILAPQASWLLLRGLRTFPLRIERMCENALR